MPTVSLFEAAPLPGFAQPVHEAQQTFRALLAAMARPGLIVPVPATPTRPEPLYGSSAALALTLFDMDTPVWLDEPARRDEVESYLRFHCGCPVPSPPEFSCFALFTRSGFETGPDELIRFPAGDAAYPDRSATLIIQVPALGQGERHVLQGPGIQGRKTLRVQGLGSSFWEARDLYAGLFPLGYDTILAAPDAFACLPRTTRRLEDAPCT